MARPSGYGIINKATLQSIGNAIRAKNGAGTLYAPGDMAAAIAGLGGTVRVAYGETTATANSLTINCGFTPKMIAFTYTGSEIYNNNDYVTGGYWKDGMGEYAAGSYGGNTTGGSLGFFYKDTYYNTEFQITTNGAFLPRGRQGQFYYGFVPNGEYSWIAISYDGNATMG